MAMMQYLRLGHEKKLAFAVPTYLCSSLYICIIFFVTQQLAQRTEPPLHATAFYNMQPRQHTHPPTQASTHTHTLNYPESHLRFKAKQLLHGRSITATASHAPIAIHTSFADDRPTGHESTSP